MNDPLTDILGICLESIERGEMSIPQCLARYPEYRQELEPLLITAATFQAAPEIAPSPAFRGAARTRLMNLIPDNPVTNSVPVRPHKQIKQPIWKRRFAMTWAIVIALVATLIGGGGAAYASEAALPGDALYPVKTAFEDIQLALADDQGDADLLLSFAQERLEEMEALAVQGRYADMQAGAQAFEHLLQQYTQVQNRLNYDNPENAADTQDRIQLLLQTQTRLMLQLQDGTGEGDAVMDQVRNAIRINVPEDVMPPVPGEGAGNQQQQQPPTETNVPPGDSGMGNGEHQQDVEKTPCPNDGTPPEDGSHNGNPMGTPDNGRGGSGGNSGGGKP